jgi:hypothetical protein
MTDGVVIDTVYIYDDYLLCFEILYPHHDLPFDALKINAVYGITRLHSSNTTSSKRFSMVLLYSDGVTCISSDDATSGCSHTRDRSGSVSTC